MFSLRVLDVVRVSVGARVRIGVGSVRGSRVRGACAPQLVIG